MIVLKYDLQPASFTLNIVKLPMGSQALRVDTQGRGLKLWVMVKGMNGGKAESRQFLVTGTGYEWNYGIDELKFINTFFNPEHDLVFHAFEVVS